MTHAHAPPSAGDLKQSKGDRQILGNKLLIEQPSTSSPESFLQRGPVLVPSLVPSNHTQMLRTETSSVLKIYQEE